MYTVPKFNRIKNGVGKAFYYFSPRTSPYIPGKEEKKNTTNTAFSLKNKQTAKPNNNEYKVNPTILRLQ